MPRLFVLLTAPLLLAGCDLLGVEAPAAAAARREAEGKAIGGACRHAARSIEDCYQNNKRADKAAVFTGWREMNDYMRENKLEAMPAPPPTAASAAAEGDEGHDADAGEAPAKKDSAKPAAKPKAAAAAKGH